MFDAIEGISVQGTNGKTRRRGARICTPSIILVAAMQNRISVRIWSTLVHYHRLPHSKHLRSLPTSRSLALSISPSSTVSRLHIGSIAIRRYHHLWLHHIYLGSLSRPLRTFDRFSQRIAASPMECRKLYHHYPCVLLCFKSYSQ